MERFSRKTRKNKKKKINVLFVILFFWWDFFFLLLLLCGLNDFYWCNNPRKNFRYYYYNIVVFDISSFSYLFTTMMINSRLNNNNKRKKKKGRTSKSINNAKVRERSSREIQDWKKALELFKYCPKPVAPSSALYNPHVYKYISHTHKKKRCCITLIQRLCVTLFVFFIKRCALTAGPVWKKKNIFDQLFWRSYLKYIFSLEIIFFFFVEKKHSFSLMCVIAPLYYRPDVLLHLVFDVKKENRS